MSQISSVQVLTRPAPQLGISPWCLSVRKRGFDVICAGILLAIAGPVMLLVALLVKLTSPGPAFFRHARIGLGGCQFDVLKFRTMFHARSETGPELTRKGDARITPLGSLLRNSKLDELPQLFNVLRGEMSLVGPRPDVARFIVTLPPEFQPVLLLKPGITSCATLKFRYEEEQLGEISTAGLEEYYIGELLPRKIALDLEYASRASFSGDLTILASTAAAILRRGSRQS